MWDVLKPAILVLLTTISVQQPQVPTLLRDAFSRHPNLRVLDPSIDRPTGYFIDDRPIPYTIEEIKRFGYWPPYVVADLDRDKREDVVAAVVQKTAEGMLFGVLAVHARTPATLRWIVPLERESLNGVGVNVASGTITPLYCIECDSNPWYRWNGRDYEPGLYAVGETIAIATFEKGQILGVRARPSEGSRLIAKVDSCTNAKVLGTRGVSAETRWYFVELQLSKPVRGWIPASLTAEMDCIG